MRLVLTTEQHVLRTPEGVFVDGDEDWRFLQRYRTCFEPVVLLARGAAAGAPPSGWRRVDGPGVDVVVLPDARHVNGWARSFPGIAPVVWSTSGAKQTAFILRPPGGVASSLWVALRVRRRPFGIEVVSDPAESFKRAAFGSVAALFLRPAAIALLRAQAASATAAAYVTERTLQSLYPPSGVSFSYSSIDIGDEAFKLAEATGRRIETQTDRLAAPRLAFTGRLRRPLKGLDTLLRASAVLVERGFDPRLTVMGGGGLLEDYRALAESLGLSRQVEFLGEVREKSELYARLAEADVFVLPSRREGLPRAVIEAMAVGLPCVATRVGGMAELLTDEHLVTPDRPVELAERVERLLHTRRLRVEASHRNAAVAGRYRRERLRRERDAFYRGVALAAKSGGTPAECEA